MKIGHGGVRSRPVEDTITLISLERVIRRQANIEQHRPIKFSRFVISEVNKERIEETYTENMDEKFETIRKKGFREGGGNENFTGCCRRTRIWSEIHPTPLGVTETFTRARREKFLSS